MPDDAEKILTPKLRFPEFRKGKAWGVEPMGTLYSFMRNNALSRDKLNYERGSVKNIHYGDIHTKFPALFDITRESVPYVNESEPVADADSDDYCIEGDLIFADASEDTNDVGKSIELVCLHGERLLSGQHTILARRNDDRLIIGFGGHLFRSGSIRAQIQTEAQGTKVYAISAKRLADIDIAFPGDKREQKKIADCLTSLDDCVAAQGRKVKALKAHKKGLMQQLFPREDETLPRIRFPEFRDEPEWEPTTLEQLVDIQSGGTPSKANPAFWNGSIPWVSAKDMKQLFLEDAEDHISGEAVEDGSRLVPAGTLLMLTRGMTLLKDVPICVLRREMSFNQDVKGLRPKLDVYGLFVAFLLLGNKQRLLRMVDIAGHGTGKLNTDELKALVLASPKPKEQQRIADCLASLNARIAAESDKLDALKTHKKGLTQQLFPAAGTSQNLLGENVINQKDAHSVAVSVATTPELDAPVVVPSRKPYKVGFARQLLAAEILQHCHKHPTMGRVKLQKLIHLCEYHAELDDIHGSYARAAAGPFDNKLMRGVANGLERQKWFKQVRAEKRASYEPMESCGQHSKYLRRWSEQLPKIHEIIRFFATAKTLSCEIASTLYAAWNDLLIDGRHPTDEEIIREASDPKRWHESKAIIEKTKWPTALNWMRAKGLVPRGYGAHTTTKRVGSEGETRSAATR